MILVIIFILLFVVGGIAYTWSPLIPTDQEKRIALAIANAEGFNQTGSLPQRANNPGDLEIGDVGFGTIDGKTIFGSVADGWNSLYHEVRAILRGTSSRGLFPTSTINEVASKYVGGIGSSNWAENVAASLGVDTSTPIGDA